MSIQPGGGRYAPDPYATVNAVLLAVMAAGTLLFIWYAASVAGLLPPPPWIFPPIEVIKQAQMQYLVYALAAVCFSEHVALGASLRNIKPQPEDTEARLAQRRMLIRIAFTAAVWIYIVVLWFVTANKSTQGV